MLIQFEKLQRVILTCGKIEIVNAVLKCVVTGFKQIVHIIPVVFNQIK